MVFAAAPEVRVMALFADKAMLQIDGNNVVMKKGQVVQGIKLISATGRGARLRMSDGREQTLGLNQSIGSAFKKPARRKLTVFSGDHGMFRVAGLVNGRSVRFILDTGASFISMSSQQADQLNLDYKKGRRGLVQTANATVPVWHLKLDRVKVGGISVANVDAVVLPGDHPPQALLGMSFLKHVKLQRNGSAMTLEQKY
jgi:aspartyl protease family protein